MRRAFATAVEFRTAVEKLAATREFSEIAARAMATGDIYYDGDFLPALEFFRSNRKILRTIRNDVGGHFGDEATANAFRAIPDDHVVQIEIQYDARDRTRLLMPFARELASAAFLAKLPGLTAEEKSKALVGLLVEVVEHAVDVVHFLVAAVLWQRMG